MWFELFYAPKDEMKVYVQIIELLKTGSCTGRSRRSPWGRPAGVPHAHLGNAAH